MMSFFKWKQWHICAISAFSPPSPFFFTGLKHDIFWHLGHSPNGLETLSSLFCPLPLLNQCGMYSSVSLYLVFFFHNRSTVKQVPAVFKIGLCSAFSPETPSSYKTLFFDSCSFVFLFGDFIFHFCFSFLLYWCSVCEQLFHPCNITQRNKVNGSIYFLPHSSTSLQNINKAHKKLRE